MTIASDLLEQYIQTLVDDNAQWQKLIPDDIVWELINAPSPGVATMKVVLVKEGLFPWIQYPRVPGHEVAGEMVEREVPEPEAGQVRSR